MSGRLFDLDDIPEVPLFREPRRSRGAQIEDERLDNAYPPEWDRCLACGGEGVVILNEDLVRQARTYGGIGGGIEVSLTHRPTGMVATGCGRSEIIAVGDAMHVLLIALRKQDPCPACLGMGSVKARVRLAAGHRCIRCGHPFMPKGDAKMLGVEPSPGHWSPCDDGCTHDGPVRIRHGEHPEWHELAVPMRAVRWHIEEGDEVEAEWRVLTVHHLDGDKANLRWWNLASLCQRCHLYIQAKVVLERVYPHEHTEWFRPYAAGYYAWAYLGEDLERPEVEARLDELLALELAPASHTL